MAAAAPGARWDRRRRADFREGAFGLKAVDVLAGGDEQLAGASGADTEEGDRARGGCCDELLELAIKLVEFAVEVADPPGEAAKGELGRLERFEQPAGVGASLEALRRALLQRAGVPELAAKLLRHGDQEVVELLQRRRPCLQRAASSDVQLPDRLDDPGCLLRERGRGATEGGAGGQLRVDRVALAEPLPGMRVRLVDLEDVDPVRRPARSARAGAASGSAPRSPRPWSETQRSDQLALAVECGCVVLIGVRVDAGGDAWCLIRHPSLHRPFGSGRRAGRRTQQ
ncbi:MAG TPA: hypothetical protein VFA66_16255 [Gaiellaceae bacterium]|nr:hypothetical protein [Gaiellaceae bacterium]